MAVFITLGLLILNAVWIIEVSAIQSSKIFKFEGLDEIQALKQQVASLAGIVEDLKVASDGLQTTVNSLKDENNKLRNQTKMTERNMRKAFLELKSENLMLKKDNKYLTSMVQEIKSDLVKVKSAENNFVSFTAWATADREYDNGTSLLFDGVLSNVGGAYDESTGIFACPIHGYYLFFANIYTHGGSMRSSLSVDGQYGTSFYSRDYLDAQANMIVTECNVGQQVSVVCTADGNQMEGSVDIFERLSTFSGALLQLLP